ncbi:hypothetical protein SARC_16277 [Sphaeroforma arctica JP610]|uniref:Uncharacterized protein n=1 Tax=Sphaeroforma arctica JP610 TaxID=667725 RepID=A0A0L0F4R3_9EUKA|nr:hypothetical protein SARC_16277 [Sphaeroforma arctica JP610]KNC71183.1 hypothetical protein SARC_16277 [Sphaeroforma arctica JP610]|eukprot:XP_014145085.1 hypothetical protein SARC_16277 [Sphaeroforma arctica JP610]
MPQHYNRPRSSRFITPELPCVKEALGQLNQRSLSGSSFPGTPTKRRTVWTPRLTPKRFKTTPTSSCSIVNALQSCKPNVAIQHLSPSGTPVPPGYPAPSCSPTSAAVAIITQYYPDKEVDHKVASEISERNSVVGPIMHLTKSPGGALGPYLYMSKHEIDTDPLVPYLYKKLLTMNIPQEWEALVREFLVLLRNAG